MTRSTVLVAALAFFITADPAPLRAQAVSLAISQIGDAGNAADSNGRGSVGYVFSIATTEVTIGNYATFLNTVATLGGTTYLTDLWQADMASDPTQAGISRSGDGTGVSPYFYTVLQNPSGSSSANRPIGYINWFRAARFANWVNNGATATSSTEIGAYALGEATTGIFERQAGASWWLPSQDEWYKAAYYKGGGGAAGYWLYPTQAPVGDEPGNTIGSTANQANYFSNGTYSTGGNSFTVNHLTDVGAFTGSAGPYGTFDMAGNVQEWNDTTFDGTRKGVLGGSWTSSEGILRSSHTGSANPSVVTDLSGYDYGFRLATSVPEPSATALLALAAVGILVMFRRRRHGRR